MPDAPTPAFTVKQLMRGAWRATLATELEGERGPWPYASLVLVACDTDIAPLLMLSDLAAHTANLKRAPNASILFDGTLGLDEPLAGPRVTVVGRVEPMDDERAKARYLRRHIGAGAYSAFSDFRLWRMAPERAHLVGGFGRISWVEAQAFVADPVAAARIAEAEPDLLETLNREDSSGLAALGHSLTGGYDWRLVGLDPDGADLRRTDGALTRAAFGAPVDGPEAIGPALRALIV
jgi:putative heme iron utilization protein